MKEECRNLEAGLWRQCCNQPKEVNKKIIFKYFPLLYGRKLKKIELDKGIKAYHLSALKLNQITNQTEQFSRRNGDFQIRKARVIYWLEL